MDDFHFPEQDFFAQHLQEGVFLGDKDFDLAFDSQGIGNLCEAYVPPPPPPPPELVNFEERKPADEQEQDIPASNRISVSTEFTVFSATSSIEDCDMFLNFDFDEPLQHTYPEENEETPPNPNNNPQNKSMRNVSNRRSSISSSVSSGPSLSSSQRYSLVGSGLERQWYTDRPHPQFCLAIMDNSTGQLASGVDHLKVTVSVLDGHGNDASDKVGPQIRNRMFDVFQSHVSILGLRFTTVSSKAGGHYRVVVSVVHPTSAASAVAPFESEKMAVLSYRLFHAPKVAFENLKPSDSVSKMKGIGEMYARRFGSVGICSLQQLAAIDLQQMGEEGTLRLLQALRKDRGSLTKRKLQGYIAQAQSIVDRYESEEPPFKKRRY